jgi:peroxiredoxin
MNRWTIGMGALALTVMTGPASFGAVKIGDLAPAFTAIDTHGKSVSLSDFRGRWVVLEWHNQGCPYVKKHYDSGSMQKVQQEWTRRGVAWLSVISSAPGQQGHVTGPDADAYVKEKQAFPTAVLLDPAGTLGHLYDAKTTPHMFVINPQRVLIYDGAIDDRPSTDQADLAGATNYVSAALLEAMAGKPVTIPATRPYGCSIKYATFGN